MNEALPLLAISGLVFVARRSGGRGRKLLETSIAFLAELRMLFIALLQGHVALIPVGERHLPWESMLIDDGLDGLVSILHNEILKASNQIFFRKNLSISMEAAD